MEPFGTEYSTVICRKGNLDIKVLILQVLSNNTKIHVSLGILVSITSLMFTVLSVNKSIPQYEA